MKLLLEWVEWALYVFLLTVLMTWTWHSGFWEMAEHVVTSEILGLILRLAFKAVKAAWKEEWQTGW